MRISKKKIRQSLALVVVFAAIGTIAGFLAFPLGDVSSCFELARRGLRPIASDRAHRFNGKVQPYTLACRSSEPIEDANASPWVDWSNYWGTADETSRADFSPLPQLNRNDRGIRGALTDLEYQRIELLKFNLFDNYTFEEYTKGGMKLKRWTAMRLPPNNPHYKEVGGAGEQACHGELIRYRTLEGICNDVFNPLMGSSGTLFARNVQFEQTFPDISSDPHARNRHGDRLSLTQPDPALISRVLFTRAQLHPDRCNLGRGLPNESASANCDYQKAPFFNVLAAFWIQFMTHDWFSHLEEGHNAAAQMQVGDGNIDRAFIAQETPPASFTNTRGQQQLSRAFKTTQNNVTAWWDASQIYGYDATSQQRVKRDPADHAKLQLIARRPDEKGGYLPLLTSADPMNPAWAGQEAVAFPDNWSIGMSFYHTVFTREHNAFVDAFRAQAKSTPDEDSGLRNPAQPDRVIRYRDVSDDELYQAARLVVAAEIAKIHTVEWTTQLLYDEVLYRGMNANWHGLFRNDQNLKQVANDLATSVDTSAALYSVATSGGGIFGRGNHHYQQTGLGGLLGRGRDIYSVGNLQDVNGGTNHFGSPFNFPEEFITVYRLHALVPDLIEMRDYHRPNAIARKVPVIATFRGNATAAMNRDGVVNWALSMGRQRLGLLTLQNHPLFLQNLPMPRVGGANNRVDVPALDLVRDRERGVPRFNEFRRQYGLRQLTSFDDFVDARLPETSQEKARQRTLASDLRRIYGQHVCDDRKVITTAQLMANGDSITDCLGHANGSVVDNVEDVDVVVGWLAEPVRPHGFAISETQFTVFILNASRRLYSDRFFTSSFRPEFYTQLGYDWVNDNGPTKMMEPGRPNGHKEEVSPFKRVLLRTMPELAPELAHVVNVFDPWARDRGAYYSLTWKPRRGAESDPAFR